MKATELRLGNWVLNESDIPCRVIGLEVDELGKQFIKTSLEGEFDGGFWLEYDDDDPNSGLDLVKPIPITGKILKKNCFGYSGLMGEDEEDDLCTFPEHYCCTCLNVYGTDIAVYCAEHPKGVYSIKITDADHNDDCGEPLYTAYCRYVHELQNILATANADISIRI